MNRRVFLTACALLAGGFAGCVNRRRTPDRMSKRDFELWVANQLQMTNVSLTDEGNGNFSGTGEKEGHTYQLKVHREEGRVSWEGKAEWTGGSSSFSGSTSW